MAIFPCEHSIEKIPVIQCSALHLGYIYFDLIQIIWRNLWTMRSPGKCHSIFKALQCILCWICWHMLGQMWPCYVTLSPKRNAFLYQCCVFSECIPSWKMLLCFGFFLPLYKRCLQTEVGGSPALWNEWNRLFRVLVSLQCTCLIKLSFECTAFANRMRRCTYVWNWSSICVY